MIGIVIFLALSSLSNAFLCRNIIARVAIPVNVNQFEIVDPTAQQVDYGMKVSRRVQAPLKDLLGFGPAEIAISLVVALVLFGPETLKSLSKDVGRAAAELKEIPKTFKEGMDEGAESAQVSKMKAIAAEKRKKRDAKVAAAGGEDEDEEAVADDKAEA
jgi:Sec-independent protein translocase protein TatA